LDADASRPAALQKLGISSVQIFLRFRTLPGGRLKAQNCELIFS